MIGLWAVAAALGASPGEVAVTPRVIALPAGSDVRRVRAVDGAVWIGDLRVDADGVVTSGTAPSVAPAAADAVVPAGAPPCDDPAGAAQVAAGAVGRRCGGAVQIGWSDGGAWVALAVPDPFAGGTLDALRAEGDHVEALITTAGRTAAIRWSPRAGAVTWTTRPVPGGAQVPWPARRSSAARPVAVRTVLHPLALDVAGVVWTERAVVLAGTLSDGRPAVAVAGR